MNVLALIGYPLFFVAAIEAWLGILLMQRKSRHDPAARAVALMAFLSSIYALSSGLVYVRASAGLSYDFFIRICWVGWLVIPAALQFLYYLAGDRRSARIAGWILYPIALAILGLCLFTDLVEAGAYSLVPFVDRAGPLENPARVLSSLPIVWAGIVLTRVRRMLVGSRKVQLDYFLLGITIYAICAVVGANLLQLFGGFGFDPVLGAYFSLPWVILTFYAITRFRLFNIRVVISRAVASIALILALGVAQIGLFKLLEGVTGSGLAVLISFSPIGLLLFNVSISRQVFDLVDRLIVRGRFDYQKILEDSTRAMISILELEELLSYIANAIKRAMKVEKVYLFTRETEGVYRLRFGAGQESGGFLGRLLKDRVMGLVNESDSTLITEQILTEALGNVDSLAYQLGSVGVELVIPMSYKGSHKGSLVLGKKGDGQPYNNRDLELLESLAGQAAVAIENARLYEEAVTDGLTGIYHHRHFENRLKEEMERSRRYKHPLSLIMIDLDRFKQINDQYGHQAGDNMLRELARTLQNGARAGDIVARYGGDEFAILLPETTARVAAEVARRLRSQVDEIRVGDLGITISLGVASTESVNSDTDLVAQADRALYQAKHHGRNRVEISDPGRDKT